MVFRVFVFICILLLLLLFLLRSNGKKEHLDEKDFRHGYGNYFKSDALEVI